MCEIQILGQGNDELIGRIEKALEIKLKSNEICLVLDMPYFKEKPIDIPKFSYCYVYNNKEKTNLDGLLSLQKVTQQFFIKDDFIPNGWRTFSIFYSDNKKLIRDLKALLPKLDGFRITEAPFLLRLKD
jgi:hypothetical protein